LAAIQIVKPFGASKIVAIDVRPERLKLAQELGAYSTIDATDNKSISALKEDGLVIVIECSGNKHAYQNAFYIAREAVVIFGYTEGMIDVPIYPMFDHELTIYNSKWLTVHDLQAVVDMIAAGKIQTAKMISVMSILKTTQKRLK